VLTGIETGLTAQHIFRHLRINNALPVISSTKNYFQMSSTIEMSMDIKG
jgi:hypothetical protein